MMRWTGNGKKDCGFSDLKEICLWDVKNRGVALEEVNGLRGVAPGG